MSSSLSIRKGATQSRDPVQAAQQLYDAIYQPDSKFTVFYCSADMDLPALGTALRERFAGVNLIGCTTAGEITPVGYLAGALTGFSLASPDLYVTTQLIRLDPFDGGRTEHDVDHLIKGLVQADGVQPGPADTFAFLLIDGLTMQEEMVVSCIYRHMQGISLVGGSAADDVQFKATHLYHAGEFKRNVALLSLVRSSFPFVAFRTQHFVKSDRRMVVTRADPARRVVFEINGAPAAPEFAKLVGLPIEQLTPLIFATHPVVVRVGGQYFVRSIAKVNEDQSLTFFCAIDEGIVLTIGTGVDMVENLREAFDEVRKTIGEPQIVLGCDCILRRLEIDREGIKDKIGRIFVDNNVIGFATYGEQFNSMHVNQTFTGIAIGARN